jgi:starch synthase
MKLLFLCEGNAESWTSWSGISKSLVDHLRAAGHTVEVGDTDLYGARRCMAAASSFWPSRRRWGTRYHLGAVPFELRSRRATASASRRRGSIDAIVQVGATFQVSPELGIPYYLCCDSNIRVAEQGAASGYSDGSGLSRRGLAMIAERERRVYRQAAGIFPLSQRLARSFVDDFGIPQERVRAIYAGPNFAPDQFTGMRVRSADRPPTVLFVGLQFHRKGGDVLVESFRRVTGRVKNARLLLVGVPRGFVEAPGVECLGTLDKNKPDDARRLLAAYAASDVFALPTRFEPFGIAFVEAMHFGLPCVGPLGSAVPEIIDDGKTGYTVPLDDVDALTDRLVSLLSDPALARAMGEAGRARAERLFTWPKVVARMTEVMTNTACSLARCS